MDPIELYLSPAEEGGQTLSEGLDPRTLTETGAVPEPEQPDGPKSFLDASGDPNSLRDQGWAVIVPHGPEGDHLLALAAPLLAQRADDLDVDAVDVYRVPAGMTAAQSVHWVDHVLVGNRPLSEIPGYVCVLGDPEQVSFELQQVLSAGFAVGRIGFQRDEDYHAYVDKLLAWELAPLAARARAVFFTARDGTPATTLGHRLLMQPTVTDVCERSQRGAYPLTEVLSFDHADPVAAADDMLDATADGAPTMLMTLSHGLGAPRRGWRSDDHQRALQGALCLGQGEHITADELTRGRFLPGGLWFVFACFGLGTPHHSVYHQWLRRLRDLGEFGSGLDAVMHSLPDPGKPGFLAALPQAVLANPNGPLAILGHLDLAWSYSFQDVEKVSRSERHRRFEPMLAPLLRGQRAGLAITGLERARSQVRTDLTTAADADALAQVSGLGDHASAAERVRLGHRWMLHHDLAGYLLLGDPAARLPVESVRRRRRDRRREHPQRPVEPCAPPPAAAYELAQHAPPCPLEQQLGHMEQIVHARIQGYSAAALAQIHGVEEYLVEQWRRVYTDAGREALAALGAAAARVDDLT
ncbi:hypothetical protein [Haliangium sp.]|uniref:hypothetical protein n=1 Tax=Haliangium sp. TaxID=2663208 RepID=UPI003D0A6ED3